MDWIDVILPGFSSAQNIHPMLVHFPVALLPLALVTVLLARWKKNDFLHKMARTLVYIGTVGALVAVATGYLATASMGHDVPGHDLVHVHRNWMIVTTILSVALSGLLLITGRSSDTITLPGVIGLALVVIVLTLGADRGANLVFEFGIGTNASELSLDSHEEDSPPEEADETHDATDHEH